MVSIMDSQSIDPGSIPGRPTILNITMASIMTLILDKEDLVSIMKHILLMVNDYNVMDLYLGRN